MARRTPRARGYGPRSPAISARTTSDFQLASHCPRVVSHIAPTPLAYLTATRCDSCAVAPLMTSILVVTDAM